MLRAPHTSESIATGRTTVLAGWWSRLPKGNYAAVTTKVRQSGCLDYRQASVYLLALTRPVIVAT